MASRQEESTAQQQLDRLGDGHDGDENCYPDVMGQFPVLDGYIHTMFGFELPLDVDRDAVASALKTGLDRVVGQIPWLGWQIGQRSGVRTAVPWPQGVARELLIVKHCDDSIPPMAQLLATGVPIGKLDASVLAPWPALPLPHGLRGPAPVITLQANFILGGLILTFSPHHTMMDGTAVLQLAKMLAAVLRGDDISTADLQQANRDRSRVVDLIPRGQPLKDHSHLRRPPGYQFVPPPSPPTWCYFKMPVTRLPVGAAASLPLQQTAQILRRELSQANTAWAIRSFATFVAREPDRSALMYNGTHDGATDVGASSTWFENQAAPPSWGALLGPSRFWRRPASSPIPGAFVAQPVEGGAIPILVCCRWRIWRG
ncbi:hypothetical protein C8A01DRAFT_37749 [Parachaetomium inaequale]|uniref:Trichothecene 3-O-acetyltransferase-like N-terminal domain-containing protein n=1 Tax=Parachaetomium inaequale TaxID=2588326 RepID=A0AAN6PCW7_9PEZI|nr:hypothetical protein C8A01DRAFT_37749 [Parachaetomium inaequale]